MTRTFMQLPLRKLRHRSCGVMLSVLGATAVFLFAPARAEAQSEAQTSELSVLIEAAPNTLNADSIRDAIGIELGVRVSASPGSDQVGVLRVRVSAKRRADLEFGTAQRSVRRGIDLPTDDARAVETIALLAGNLVRDEASELVAELRRREMERKAAAAAALAATDGSGLPKGGSEKAGTADVSAESGTAPRPPSSATASPPPTAASPRPPAVAATAGAKPSPPDERGKAEPAPGVKLKDTFFNASLFHPVSIHSDSELRRFNLELALIYGRIGALNGFGATVLVSSVDKGFRGVQLTGLASYTGGDSTGVSAAGGATISRGLLRGVEGAGGVNLRLGGPKGDRPFSFTEGARLEGVQVAGGYNHLAGNGEGAQLGTVNVTMGSLDGLQLGVVNYANRLRGAQLGAVNVGHETNGAQLGAVNVGGHADGFQLGAVNVANEMNGVPIGLVSVAKNTRFSAIAFASTRFPANVGLKTITGHVVNEYSIGADISDGTDNGIGQLAVSIGAHVPFGDFFLEPTVGWGHERRFDDRTTGNATNTVLYRAKLGWQVSEAFSVFAGGGLVQAIPESTGRSELEGGEGLLGIQLF